MNKLCYTGCFLFIAIIIGMLYWFSAPTMSDDILYHFVWQKDWQQPLRQIQSLSDVIQSQWIHYECLNGRTIMHSMAQLMINFIPYKIVNILNTIVFLLLIWLITLYVSHQKNNHSIIAMMSFAMLFLVISGFGTGFIWIMGAFNYLWSLVFNMCFLIMLRQLGEKRMNWKLLPLILFSFIAGWTHEGFSLPLATSLIIYIILHHRHILKQANVYCISAYTLGMLMIVTSPALWWRADIDGISISQRLLYGIINLLFGIRLSWIMIITLIVVWFKDRKEFMTIVKRHRYMLFAWMIAIAIVFCCGTTLERVPICADFIAMLIVLDIWQGHFLQNWRKGIITSIMIVSVIVAIPAVSFYYFNYQNYIYHCSQLRQPDVTLLRVRQMPVDMNIVFQKIYQRYVIPTIEFNFNNVYMAFDAQDNNNKALASLYGKQQVIALPEDIIERIENDSTAFTDWETDIHNNLYVKKINDSQHIDNVTFILGPEIPLHFYQLPFSYEGNEYILNPFNYDVIDIFHHRYLVLTIPKSNIKRRIKDIKLS